MKLLKRIYCLLFGHKWKAYGYSSQTDWGEEWDVEYICERCNKEYSCC